MTSIDGTAGSAAGVAESVMAINSTMPVSSTWKLNEPKAILKPPIFVEADPVERGMGSTIAAIGVLMAIGGAESMIVGGAASMMVGEAVSTTVGKAVSTMVGKAVSTMVGEAVSMMVGGAVLTMVGGAESTIVGDEPTMFGDCNAPTFVTQI
jgi:hypothetical protein